MSPRHLIVATAGHVDHGKSALVKALSGIDPDRLPEEKARGITIDLGFAHVVFPAPASAESNGSILAGIVDVPGHEDFVKNMVAGVGSVDLALLIVAADDGWMPQTEEHVQILSYLGVRHMVVALTKVDLIEESLDPMEAEIRRHLEGTPWPRAPIARTSTITEDGLLQLRAVLVQTLNGLPLPRDLGKPRLPVDRVFSLPGIGTVVTGTLTGGCFDRGQSVAVQPTGQLTRLRTVQNYHQDSEQAKPGMRTAVNLPDVDVSGKGHFTTESKRIQRGDVIAPLDLGRACDTMDVLLEKSARLIDSKSKAARPLKDGALVRIHHGSGNAPARVMLAGAEPLQAGGRMLAQLRFEWPIYAFVGDRFIVRDWAEQCTLAGGVILDADADRRRFRKPEQRTFLETRANAPEDVSVCIVAQVKRDRAVRTQGLLGKSNFSAGEIAKALQQLAAAGSLAASGDWILDTQWWSGVLASAQNAIQTEHQTHSDRPGLVLIELKRLLQEQLPNEELFSAALADLSRLGYVQSGTAIRHGSHRPSLPGPLQSAGARLRAALQSKPMEPPAKKDLLAIPQAAQALRFLCETGDAVDLGPESVISGEAFARAKGQIVAFIQKQGSATASELRQLLQTNRRIIIPLLERMDRDGVTLRQGDKRVLRAG